MEQLYTIKIYLKRQMLKPDFEYNHRTKQEIEQIKKDLNYYVISKNKSGYISQITEEY